MLGSAVLNILYDLVFCRQIEPYSKVIQTENKHNITVDKSVNARLGFFPMRVQGGFGDDFLNILLNFSSSTSCINVILSALRSYVLFDNPISIFVVV